MKKFILLFVLLFVFVVTGCSGSSNDVVGKWYYYNGYNMVIFEFKDDGTYLHYFDDENDENCPYSVSGNIIDIKCEKNARKVTCERDGDNLKISGITFYSSSKLAWTAAGKSLNIEVPDIAGHNEGIADEMLIRAGFKVEIRHFDEPNKSMSGFCWKTEPKAYEIAEYGSLVILYCEE